MWNVQLCYYSQLFGPRAIKTLETYFKLKFAQKKNQTDQVIF